MSLRLLLADESPSIKKAFELPLQDFGVKIQTVHQGSDVPELFASFNPDICFMDVMLQKVNGYDSSRILKLDESSKETPIVLMWSSFMELDAEKYKTSLADGNIEKPFETSTLRDLVKSLVPHLNQNEISDHLIFDEPNFEEDSSNLNLSDAITETESDIPPLKEISFDSNNLDHDDLTDPGVLADAPDIPDMPDFDSILGDEPVSNKSFETPEGMDFGSIETESLETEDWKETPQKDSVLTSPEGLEDVDSFSLESLDNTSLPFEAPTENELDDDEVTGSIDLPPIPAQVLTPLENLKSAHEVADLSSEETVDGKSLDELKLDTSKIPQLSKEELKRLILAQSKDIIESVVWDVVPELARELIQKEIQRLTGEIKYESDLR